MVREAVPVWVIEGVLVRLGVGVIDGVLVIVGLEELVEVREGVWLREGVGLIEAGAVEVNVYGEVLVRVFVGIKVRVLSSGWKGVLVSGAGRLVIEPVSVAMTGVGVCSKGRNVETNEGMSQPVRRKIISSQGIIPVLFLFISWYHN